MWHRIPVSDLACSKGAIRVAAGSTVVWTDEDEIHHTATPAAPKCARLRRMISLNMRLVGLVVGLVLLGSGCGSDSESTDPAESESLPTAPASDDAEPETAGPAAEATSEVSVAGFAFVPAAIEVPAGATVVWTNEDDTLHTVTPSEGDATGFGGGLDGAGATVEVTFDETGTYEYFCSIHPSMVGAVTVV